MCADCYVTTLPQRKRALAQRNNVTLDVTRAVSPAGTFSEPDADILILKMVGVELMHVALKELVATIITQHAGSSSNTIAVSEAIAALSQLPMLLEELFDLRSNTVTLLAPPRLALPTLAPSPAPSLVFTTQNTTDKNTIDRKGSSSILLYILGAVLGGIVLLIMCAKVVFIHKRTSKRRHEQQVAQLASTESQVRCIQTGATSTSFPTFKRLSVDAEPSARKLFKQRPLLLENAALVENVARREWSGNQASGSTQILGGKDSMQGVEDRLERARKALEDRLASDSERTKTMLVQQMWLLQTMRRESNLFESPRETNSMTNNEARCNDDQESGSMQSLGGEDNLQATSMQARLERARKSLEDRLDCDSPRQDSERLESNSERKRNMLAQQIWLLRTMQQGADVHNLNSMSTDGNFNSMSASDYLNSLRTDDYLSSVRTDDE